MNDIKRFYEVCSLIEKVEEEYQDIGRIDDDLIELLDLIKNSVEFRSEIIEYFKDIVRGKRHPVEIVIFCMRELQWDEIREFALEKKAESEDFRVAYVLDQVLAVYEDEWEDADLYRYYAE